MTHAQNTQTMNDSPAHLWTTLPSVGTAALCAVAMIASACGGGSGSAFRPTFPDNRSTDIDAVLARVHAAPARQDEPLAVGVTASPHTLYAVDLNGGSVRWRKTLQGSIVAAPLLAGGTVLTHESAGIVGRSTRSGDTQFTTGDAGLHLVGADGEGDLVAFALSTGGGVSARSKLVVARGGRIAWTKEVEFALGAPTVVGGLVFVPWATQNVSVLDAASGDELARIRITDSAVGRAFREGADVYFAQRGVFRLTSSIAGGSTSSAAYFEPQLRDIPGNPTFVVDPYRPPPTPESAVHRIRYSWRPAGSGEEVSLAGDVLYGTFYKLIFGLVPTEDDVRWVYEHDADIVGASAQPGGLIVADAEGNFGFVSAVDGRRHWHASTDIQPLVVTIRGGDFEPNGAAEGEVHTLHDQLLAAAQSTDSRLVPARILAVHMLRAIQDDDVTGHLIALCEDRSAPPAVRNEACTSLAARTTGEQHVVDALGRYTRYLTGTTAGPLGPLTRAAVSMGATASVPHLVAHLRDPQTSEEDLKLVIDALGALEGTAATEPLRDFVRLYHAEAQSDAMVQAIGAAGDVLVALGDEDAEALLRAVRTDELAPRAVRDRVQVTLTAIEVARAEAEAAAEAGAEGEGEGETEGETTGDQVAGDNRPERATLPMIERVLAPIRAQIHACLAEAEVRTARLVLALDDEGNIASLNMPQNIRSCVEPLIRAQRYPGNRRGVREQFSLTVR